MSQQEAAGQARGQEAAEDDSEPFGMPQQPSGTRLEAECAEHGDSCLSMQYLT
jgi:hypothetical protein